MSLQTLVAHTLHNATATIKKNAVGYSICVVCALALLVLVTMAGVLALLPLVGAVYALLIAAGVYLAVIIGTMIWLQNATARPAVRVTAPPAGVGVTMDPTASQRQMQFAQLAMIIEAAMLGYSLSRKR